MKTSNSAADGTADYRWMGDLVITLSLLSFSAGLYRRVVEYTHFPTPVSSLRTMSDHALRDIGLSRTDLPAISWPSRQASNICKAGGRVAERAAHPTSVSQ
jgi:uncharacterized protein YjiS (DUF1127 family)